MSLTPVEHLATRGIETIADFLQLLPAVDLQSQMIDAGGLPTV